MYSSVFVWLTSQTVRMRLISCFLYLSIYAGLPVSGERNKNQNYAYVRNQTTDVAVTHTHQPNENEIFCIKCTNQFFILYVMHTLVHTVHRGK